MNIEERLTQIAKKLQSEIPITRYIAVRHLTGIITQQPETIQQLTQTQPQALMKIISQLEIITEENEKNQIIIEETQRTLTELKKILPETLIPHKPTTKTQPLQTCPQCNTPNQNEWQYCPNCGTQRTPQKGTVTCLNCKKHIKPLQSCPECGTHL